MFAAAFMFLMITIFCFWMSRKLNRYASSSWCRCDSLGLYSGLGEYDLTAEYDDYGEKTAICLWDVDGHQFRYDLTLDPESTEGRQHFAEMVRFVQRNKIK